MLRRPGIPESVFSAMSCIRPASTPSCPLCSRRIESNSRVSNTGISLGIAFGFCSETCSAGFGSLTESTRRRIVGRTFRMTASLSLICGSTAIMKPSAATFGVVVNDG